MANPPTSSSEPATEPAFAEAPDTALVPCPMVGFRHRRVARCAACEHCRGLVQTTEADVPFNHKYRIACAHVVARRMSLIEE